MSAPKLRLHYFAIPGRAEPSRIALTLGGIEHEFVVIPSFKDWPAIKHTTPFGQVPVLEVGDKKLAQSGAILRYVSKLGGLYPEDPWDAALADQASLLLADAFEPFAATARLSDQEEKLKKRAEMWEGPMKAKFKLIEGLLADRDYFTGSKPTFADIELFCMLSSLKSGFFDGFPTDYLGEFPVLKAFRNRFASLERVKALYAGCAADAVRSHFVPDADAPVANAAE